MKLYLFSILFSISLLAKAQSFEFEIGTGTGQAYLIEHLDKSVEVDHSMTVNLYSSIIYRNVDSYFDLNVTFISMNSSVRGTDWINDLPLD